MNLFGKIREAAVLLIVTEADIEFAQGLLSQTRLQIEETRTICSPSDMTFERHRLSGLRDNNRNYEAELRRLKLLAVDANIVLCDCYDELVAAPCGRPVDWEIHTGYVGPETKAEAVVLFNRGGYCIMHVLPDTP